MSRIDEQELYALAVWLADMLVDGKDKRLFELHSATFKVIAERIKTCPLLNRP